MALGPVNVTEKKISQYDSQNYLFQFIQTLQSIAPLHGFSIFQLQNSMYTQFWCWVIGSWQMPSKSRESIEKVDNWWWMAARMWLQFDRRTTAGANCRDLTDRMGHHTWVLAIMEFKVKGINRKSQQLMMDMWRRDCDYSLIGVQRQEQAETWPNWGCPIRWVTTLEYLQLWSSKSRESIEKVDNWWWMAAKMWLQFDGRTMAGASWDLTKLRVSDPMGHHTWVVTIMEFKVKGINRKSWQLMMD